MNDQRDPLFEALDRLAGVADADPVVDRLPGIARKARANRNRAVALTAGGAAAAIVVGGTVLANAGWWPDDRTPGVATQPPSSTQSALPDVRTLAALSADVDGDGTDDRVELLVPVATANDEPAPSSWLRVTVAGGEVTTQVTSSPTYVSFLTDGPTEAPAILDIDGNGTSEVLLSTTEGGDGASVSVWTWTGSGLEHARAVADSPADIAANGDLAEAAEAVGVATDAGVLQSYAFQSYPPTAPYEVRLWQWDLAGTELTATEVDGRQCFDIDTRSIGPC